MTSRSRQLLRLATRAGVIRAKDLAVHGIPRVYLKRLHDKGVLQRAGRGLYTLAGASVTEHHTLVEAAKRVPHGVVCLLSALSFHKLTTQLPFEVWIAIDPWARKPRPDYPPLRIVRMIRKAREAGIEEHTLEGIPVRITSAAKTVVDCFKFRNKLGLDVALEALRDYRRDHRRNLDELWRLAKTCRVANVMRPYIEAVT